MKILKIVSCIFLCFIGIVAFATVIAIGTLATYYFLQILLFAKGDYLLFVSNELNMIPINLILILIVYACFQLIKTYFYSKKTKIEEMDHPIQIETKDGFINFINKIIDLMVSKDVRILKAYKLIRRIYVGVLLVTIYFGMTSYSILYTDSIKVSTPFVPTGIIYDFNDVKSIDVGVEKESQNVYEVYYNVKFSDGNIVDFFGGSMMSNNEKDLELLIIDFDEKLKVHNVNKTVNKVNFEAYSLDLDKNYVNRIEQLF